MFHFLGVYHIFVYCKSHPNLLEYWLFAIIFIFGVAPSIWTTSSWVILASYTAMTTILFILMILAIFGHFELWAPSFFPLMFQDAIVIPFFFRIFDWKCFLVLSHSVIFLSSTLDISEDVSTPLQNGFSLIYLGAGSCCEVSDSSVEEGLTPSSGSLSSGPLFLGVVVLLMRLTTPLSILCASCISARVPRPGTIDRSTGVARLHPSSPLFFPLTPWVSGGLDMR